jgi:hypothetical protein
MSPLTCYEIFSSQVVLSQVSSNNARPASNNLTDSLKGYRSEIFVNDCDGVVGNDLANRKMPLELLVTVLHFALCDSQRSFDKPIVC